MFKIAGRVFATTIVLATVAFGGKEALAGQAALSTSSSCGSYNWCAPSQGSDVNCNTCCPRFGGLCYDYREEDNFIGCLCY